ncbi:MAG: hypothetical protein IRZ28_08115 [Steroidobacteraceae bacterium]|nr:hypothetical protein [Steroidobacteraceae bacterium]
MAYEVPLLRSLIAVGAGFFATAVLSLGGDLTFSHLAPHAFDGNGRPSTDEAYAIIAAYTALFGFAGGYIAARIASRRHVAHAVASGLLTLAISGVVAFFMWDATPAWYNVTNLLLILPVAFLGGKLRELQLARNA